MTCALSFSQSALKFIGLLKQPVQFTDIHVWSIVTDVSWIPQTQGQKSHRRSCCAGPRWRLLACLSDTKQAQVWLKHKLHKSSTVSYWSSADTVLQGEESKAKAEQIKAKKKPDMPRKDGADIPALCFTPGMKHMEVPLWQLRNCINQPNSM